MLNPLASERWSFTTAAHLLNRAGFGGPPAEIEKLVALGPEKAVSHFTDYEAIPDPTPDPLWAKPDPDPAEKFLGPRRPSPAERRELRPAEAHAQRQPRT